ncbi:GntR family transcriptional regulator [Acetobacteraceae bacterium H6797]|nr:GntR family transcriptional regulator [Acetobacteraceae bacterium H6797]
MEDRLAWVRSYERSHDAGAVCREFGISRATLRKWWERYAAEGVAGLAERSRAPLASPNRKVAPEDEAAIKALREEGLGFLRIQQRLKAEGRALSTSTIRRVLDRLEEAAPAPRPAPRAPARQGLLAEPEEGLAAALAQQITLGRYKPGEKLAEAALAAQFGVGRTRIREGLRHLAATGLVKLEKNRGAFVAMPSREEVAKAYEARRVVEGGIIAGLGSCCGAGQIESLRKHVAQQRAAEAAGQRVRLVRLLTEFHLLLASMSQNVFLRGFLEKLTITTSLAVLIYDHEKTSPACAIQEHADIVEHLARGEIEAASAVMARHLGQNQARVSLTCETVSSA